MDVDELIEYRDNLQSFLQSHKSRWTAMTVQVRESWLNEEELLGENFYSRPYDQFYLYCLLGIPAYMLNVGLIVNAISVTAWMLKEGHKAKFTLDVGTSIGVKMLVVLNAMRDLFQHHGRWEKYFERHHGSWFSVNIIGEPSEYINVQLGAFMRDKYQLMKQLNQLKQSIESSITFSISYNQTVDDS